MFPCTSPQIAHPQQPRRHRRLPAALLAAVLLLATGAAAQAAPGQAGGTAPAEAPAGLLASVWSWLLSLVGPQDNGADGAGTATAPEPTADGQQVLSFAGGGATYDPTTDAGSRMDPNG